MRQLRLGFRVRALLHKPASHITTSVWLSAPPVYKFLSLGSKCVLGIRVNELVEVQRQQARLWILVQGPGLMRSEARKPKTRR